jgi:hypothetical protein
VKNDLSCPGCNALASSSCECGLGYIPLKPRERAEKELRANPTASNRMIAEKIGVSHITVDRERGRMNTSGGTNVPPDKVKGKDGKWYVRIKPTTDPRVRKAALLILDSEKSIDEASAEMGLGEHNRAVREEVAREQGRREAEENIDPTTWPQRYQDQLAKLRRADERRIEAILAQRFQEFKAETVKKYLPILEKEEELANQVLNARNGFMTKEMYRRIRAALHPDSHNNRSPDLLRELYEEWSKFEIVATSQKNNPIVLNEIKRAAEKFWSESKSI